METNPDRPERPADETAKGRPHADRPFIDRSREDRPSRRARSDAAARNERGTFPVDPKLAELIAAHADRPGALLPLLHAVQAAFGHIASTAVPAIARGLNLSRAEVHGVIAYYTHFHDHPPGRHIIQLCRAESCKACGADELAERASQALGCALDSTRGDGAVTLESVFCLGLCSLSPAASIDGRLHARLSLEGFDRLLARLDLSPVKLGGASPSAGGAAVSGPAQPAEAGRRQLV